MKHYLKLFSFTFSLVRWNNSGQGFQKAARQFISSGNPIHPIANYRMWPGSGT
jgi:hypothetical protein